MTVAELIAVLQTKPPDLQVAYRCYSEWNLLKAKEIEIKTLCPPHADGWIHDARPDRSTQDYVTFPGN
jgi:hypothetical protein